MTCWLNWIQLTPAGPAGPAWRCWLTGWNQEGRWIKQRYGPLWHHNNKVCLPKLLLPDQRVWEVLLQFWKWLTNQNKSKQMHQRPCLSCCFLIILIFSTISPPFKSGLQFCILAWTSWYVLLILIEFDRSEAQEHTATEKWRKYHRRSLWKILLICWIIFIFYLQNHIGSFYHIIVI